MQDTEKVASELEVQVQQVEPWNVKTHGELIKYRRGEMRDRRFKDGGSLRLMLRPAVNGSIL